jgi:HK97 family phage major capsid protein
MTLEELKAQIKDVTLPTVKEYVGSKEIADLIEEACRKALEKQAPAGDGGPPAWLGALLSERAAPVSTEKGLGFGSFVRFLAAAKGDREKAAMLAKRAGQDDVAKVISGAVEKAAMSAGDPLAGGTLVPEQYSAEVIELLRPASIVRALGPVVIPMAASFNLPKVTDGATAYYQGENTNATKSLVKTGNVRLAYKKLIALVPLSNDLLRFSSPGADAIVRNDSVRAMAQRENQGFLRDLGTEFTPKGLRYWAPSSNVILANATASLANITTDLGKLILKLMQANVPFTRPGWIFSPRTYMYLWTVQTTVGNYAYQSEMATGKLWGWPFKVSTQVPETLTTNEAETTGTTGSEIYLADFADAVIGESLGLLLDASGEASYMDGGTLVSAFSQDQTVIRVISEHDFVMRRDVSVAVLKGVVYGV